jgi:methylthioribose-1-phosphate isomerase
MIETIQWNADGVVMIDQTRLPAEEKYVTCRTYGEVADAIRTMIIRGAPAIGVAAAMGVAIGVAQADPANLDAQFETICAELASTRPTAVNLFWGIERMKRLYASIRHLPVEQIRERLIAEAKLVREEDIEINRAIGRHGAPLVPDGRTVLTHCNAGALATAGYGTALGVVRAAVEAGKKIDVYADETRPFLQGARLTVWELQHDGIPATLITDNMAGYFLHAGKIGCVIVGADRIAANGDVANKIGTYGVAVLAKENNVPFYVAAPISTLDLTLPDGTHIPIEERGQAEVTHLQGVRVAPEGTAARNPAFDVTPNRYVTAIITELGVARAPYLESLRELTGRDRLDEPILAGL